MPTDKQPDKKRLSAETRAKMAQAQRQRRTQEGGSRLERELRREVERLRALQAEIDEQLPRAEAALRAFTGEA